MWNSHTRPENRQIRLRTSLSSEKYDMSCPISANRTSPLSGTNDTEVAMLARQDVVLNEQGPAIELPEQTLMEMDPFGLCLECASHDWSCGTLIPEDVVANAWREELEAGGERADRFFHFIWNGGVWAAFGLQDGRVRGVSCPSHNAERASQPWAGQSQVIEYSVVLELAS